MNLPTAQRYAAQIVEWLTPYCERIEIAGSIRRARPNCNDVDVVAIPKMNVETDMLGAVVKQQNLLWDFLAAHVAKGNAAFRAGGQVPGKFCVLLLKKCQLDVFFATPETWATRFLCRTGSKEHNIWLCNQAEAKGGKWETYEGLRLNGEIMPTKTEEEIYQALGLPFIAPENREKWWIASNVEGGDQP